MPNIDASDYIRKLKLTAIYNANKAADQRKFRALTRFDSYDPSAIRASGAVCNDVCITTPKNHNIFGAQAYSASRVPHFNTSSLGGGCAGGIVIDFTNAIHGSVGGFYVNYSIPTPTQSIKFIYTNILNGDFPEIDSDTFNFETDGSTLVVNGSSQMLYNGPYFGNYCVYNENVSMTSGSCVTLNTNSPISGDLYVGYYNLSQT